jgi:parvulin-like peptidyl-prolyl isomerase
MKKKWVILLCLLVFFGQCKKKSPGAGTASPVDPAATVDDRTILTIGAVAVTNRDLKNFIQLQYADIFEKKNNDKLLSRLFDVFCEQQVILFRARQEGIQVGDDEVTEFLGEVQARGQAPDLDRELVRNTLKVQKFLLAGAYRDIDVSDGEIARYYESHLGDYQKTEEIELYQIMVKDREKLLQIRSELLGRPARFEEVSRSESISPEADKGGAMGFFEKGVLPREMEEVVFSLKVNEISPIVESPYGFHLFKVTRKRKSRMQLLADVKDEIRSKLLSAKLTAAYADFLRGLKAEVPTQARYDNLYFNYIKPDPGVNENESKNPSGNDTVSNG